MRKQLITVGLLLIGFACRGALAAPCAGFVDVDSTSGFCSSVAWVKSRGITVGCTDASHYCPNDPVTRLQMAAFMYRLGFQNTVLNGGNAFGTTAVLGTTDNQPVNILVNGSRVMRYEPSATSPNVIGGHPNNSVFIGVAGASIAGGGAAGVQFAPLLGNFCMLGYGCLNGVTDDWGTIGGGVGNQAGDGVGTTSDTPFATVAGGLSNWARDEFSTVGGGVYNTASGGAATVGGGVGNTASGYAATVPGGFDNTAAANFSFAAGHYAVIPDSAPGSFLWADSNGAALPAGAHDEFIAVASNGIGFYTYKDFSHGCALVGLAGSWSCTSDRATKSDFTVIEPRDILARVVAMPITQWRWKGEAETVRHVGPTAQDFRAAFGLGYDDKTITLVDTEGIALAAIQGLYAELKERDATIAELRERVTQVESLRGELAALRDSIAAAAKNPAIAAQADPVAP
jgi:hypothetical protein